MKNSRRLLWWLAWRLWRVCSTAMPMVKLWSALVWIPCLAYLAGFAVIQMAIAVAPIWVAKQLGTV
jgi:hypothetical protein